MWESILGAVAGPVLGGLLGGDSAEEAADTQAAAADRATRASERATERAIAENRRQFDLTRSDLAPYRSAGTEALDYLRRYMGIRPSVDKSKFTTTEEELVAANADNFDAEGYLRANPDVAASKYASNPLAHYDEWGYKEPRKQYVKREVFDEAAYNAAVAQAEKDAAAVTPLTAELTRKFRMEDLLNDPVLNLASDQKTRDAINSGFLTRRFTMEDMENDPVFQKQFAFGLSEGEKAVKRMFGARGMGRSGAAVKAATRFATDYTGTKGQDAYGRFMGDQATLYGKVGDSYNRYTADNSNLFNKLAAVSGIGQAATTTTANAGGSMAGANAGLMAAGGASTGDYLTGAGNARGAASIARGNSIGGGFANAGNSINGMFTLDRILNSGGGSRGSVPLVQPSVPGQFSLDTYDLSGSYTPSYLRS